MLRRIRRSQPTAVQDASSAEFAPALRTNIDRRCPGWIEAAGGESAARGSGSESPYALTLER